MPPSALPASIPGYYFDAEKGKYFKIIPSWKAPPGATERGDFVTTDTVRKRRRDEELNEVRTKEAREEGLVRAQRAQKKSTRRNLLGLINGVSRGELGPREARRDLDMLLAAGLRLVHKQVPWGYAALDIDLATGTPFIGNSNGLVLEVPDLVPGRRAPRTASYAADGPVTSVQGLGSGRVAATLLGASGRPGKLVIVEPKGDDITLKQIYSWSPKLGSMFSSAVAVPHSKGNVSLLALGLSRGLVVIPDLDIPTAIKSLRSPSDVFALAFANPSTVLAGLRDGRLASWDLRAKGPPTFIGKHGGSVTSIASVNVGRHLISAASDGTILLHDARRTGKELIRYPHPAHADSLARVSMAVSSKGSFVYVLGEHGIRGYSVWNGREVVRRECAEGVLRAGLNGEVWSANADGLFRWAPGFAG